MWTLIHLYEPPDAKTPDLIPNAWIIDNDTCWYPMSFRLSKIKSLAREKAKPNTNDWEKFKIEIVESNIDNYDYGIKLMYKLLKNKSKKNLHSDAELKGRGMRKKLKYEDHNTKNLFSNLTSDSDNSDEVFHISVKQKSSTTQLDYPNFPKKKKENHNFDECAVLKEKTSTPRQSNKLGLSAINTSTPLDNHQLIDADFETPHIALHNNYDSALSNENCKLNKKNNHHCSFESQNNNTNKDENYQLLVSLGHQLCRLSADFMKFKSNMNYLKLELTSFIENKEASTLQNNTFNQEKTDDVLSTFPINDEEKLLTLESKLASYDLGYNDKLLSAFMFASEGKSISKVTNSLLKTIFTDKFASAYSWKGQKEKKKLENYKIFKVIINCVGKKFPNSENYKMDVIASVMNWFAQAPTRILRDEKRNLKSAENMPAAELLQSSSFDEDDTT